MKTIRYGSVCSGIEAVTVAWRDLEVDGLRFEPAFFSEVEPFCCELLRQRFPTVPNLGDITREDWAQRAAALGPIDVLVGGSPCTGFSTAGKKEGLDDPRSALAITFVRIAQELRPQVVLWENVPGVFTTNGGRDFGAFLGALVDAGFGRLAWRVLDAQWFGLAQRRARLFLVASSGTGSLPDAVLFEPGCEGRRPEEGRKARKEPARTSGESPEDVVCVHSDSPVRTGDANTPSPDADGRVRLRQPGLGVADDGTSYTLSATGLHAVAYNVNATYSCARQDHALETDTARCLDSAGGFSSQQGGTVVVGREEAYQCHGTNVGPMGTLRAGNGNETGGVTFVVQAEAVGFTNTGAGWWNEAESTTPLAHREYKSATTLVVDQSGSRTEDAQAFYTSAGGHATMLGDRSPPLKTCEGGGHGAAIGAVLRDGLRYIVRRLTPREAERLQGFPDDWTLIEFPQGRTRLKLHVVREIVLYLNATTGRDWTEAEVRRLGADSKRYAALGNSMAVPVMSWLGRRLLRVFAMLDRGEEVPTEMA